LSHNSPRYSSFHYFLYACDRELAQKARDGRCPFCGAKLHSANYFRRPRGGLFCREVRFSFCCCREGCRKRVTPASMRFLGRRVYLGIWVILVSALRHGVTRPRLAKLQEHLDISERTLVRWRRWWIEAFAESRFWKAAGGWFSRPVDPEALPASLLERFAGDEMARLGAALRFLLPITGGRGLAFHDLRGP
jgi:hypothetical protein